MHRLLLLLVALLALLSVSACQPITPEEDIGMANPASVYCGENGGTTDIRTDDAGNEIGYCVFEDGSECEEWAYFRDECEPGSE